MNEIQTEILAAIAVASEPVGNADIIGDVHSAQDPTDISKAFYKMRKEGLIEEATDPTVIGRNGQPKRTYNITDAGRNALADSMTGNQIQNIVIDELTGQDDVLLAIEDAKLGAPIRNADVHAERLRAIASWPALDDQIADWLEDLADQLYPRTT